jgi:RimJ/RimL family protein N-acetyltransferase
VSGDRAVRPHRIRDATASDVGMIAEAHVEAWRTAYADLMPRSAIESHTLDERRGQWGQIVADPSRRALVVEDAEGIAGFALYGRPEDENGTQDTGELLGIYLVERAIGLGVGRELLDRATRDLAALGYRRGVLWVLEANARARRFYEAAGWRTDGATRPHPVGDVELPVIRYTLELGSSG